MTADEIAKLRNELLYVMSILVLTKARLRQDSLTLDMVESVMEQITQARNHLAKQLPNLLLAIDQLEDMMSEPVK